MSADGAFGNPAGHGAEAYLVSPTSPQAQAALRALQEAFNREPVLLREGGSIPIVNDFRKVPSARTHYLSASDCRGTTPIRRTGRILTSTVCENSKQ